MYCYSVHVCMKNLKARIPCQVHIYISFNLKFLCLLASISFNNCNAFFVMKIELIIVLYSMVVGILSTSYEGKYSFTFCLNFEFIIPIIVSSSIERFPESKLTHPFKNSKKQSSSLSLFFVFRAPKISSKTSSVSFRILRGVINSEVSLKISSLFNKMQSSFRVLSISNKDSTI